MDCEQILQSLAMRSKVSKYSTAWQRSSGSRNQRRTHVALLLQLGPLSCPSAGAMRQGIRRVADKDRMMSCSTQRIPAASSNALQLEHALELGQTAGPCYFAIPLTLPLRVPLAGVTRARAE